MWLTIKTVIYFPSLASKVLSDIYILLDGLVCSIVGYFYESRRARRASQNTRDDNLATKWKSGL